MQRVSFSLTWPQILARTKTITRRANWRHEPGHRLQTVEKMQGLKKGQKQNAGPIIEVVSVRQERADALTWDYSPIDVKHELEREGFPGYGPDLFLAKIKKDCGIKPNQNIFRIEFRYVTRLYLAGPMTGYPHFNFPAFELAATDLRRAGYEVFSPAEFERARGFDPAKDPARSHKECLADDLPSMLRCDGVALLPGWCMSAGTKIELAVARPLSMPCEQVHVWIERTRTKS